MKNAEDNPPTDPAQADAPAPSAQADDAPVSELSGGAGGSGGSGDSGGPWISGRKLVVIAVVVLAGLVAMSMVVSAMGGPVMAMLVFGVVVALLVARAWDKRQLRRLRAQAERRPKRTRPAKPSKAASSNSVLYLAPVHRVACGVAFATLGALVCFPAEQPWPIGLVAGLFVGLLFDYVLRVALVIIVLGMLYLVVVYGVLPQMN